MNLIKKLLFLRLTALFALVFLLFCFGITSKVIGSEKELRGRHFVQLGQFVTVTGTLKTQLGEWFLIENNTIYQIHMGDHKHREKTGIELKEGKKATLTGFLYSQEGYDNLDIAVCTIEIKGRVYRFRKDDGTPLWRGYGSQKGYQSDR